MMRRGKGLRRLAAALLLTLLALAPLGCMARQVTEPMWLLALSSDPDGRLRVLHMQADGACAVAATLDGLRSGIWTAQSGDMLYWFEDTWQDGVTRRILCALDLHTGEKTIVQDGPALQALSLYPYWMQYIDGWVYVAGYAGGDGALYRLSATAVEYVGKGAFPFWGFATDGTWLYYVDDGALCRVRLDGSEPSRVWELGDYPIHSSLQYEAGRLYYVDQSGIVRSVSTADGSMRVEMTEPRVAEVVVQDGRLFYYAELPTRDAAASEANLLLCAKMLDSGRVVTYGPVYDGGETGDLQGRLTFGERGFVYNNYRGALNMPAQTHNRYVYYPYDGRPPVELELTHWE